MSVGDWVPGGGRLLRFRLLLAGFVTFAGLFRAGFVALAARAVAAAFVGGSGELALGELAIVVAVELAEAVLPGSGAFISALLGVELLLAHLAIRVRVHLL